MASDSVVVDTFFLGCLGQISYAASHAGNCVIIDPRRDIAAYQSYLKERNLRLVGILLTHIHADFIAGHVELSEACCSGGGGGSSPVPIYIGANSKANFKHMHAVSTDYQISISDTYKLAALETPGHTFGCVTYLLKQEDAVERAFTGDTLFVGSVGRPDLLGTEGHTAEEMASMMFETIDVKLRNLGDHVIVHPAHGAGSPCGGMASDKLYSTIGQEKTTNKAFQYTRACKSEFIAWLTGQNLLSPQYFHEAVSENKYGSSNLERFLSLDSFDVDNAAVTSSESNPNLNAIIEKKYLQEAGAFFQMLKESREGAESGNGRTFLLDVREQDDFAKRYLKGSINLALGGKGGCANGDTMQALNPAPLENHEGTFAIWLGTLFSNKDALYIIAPCGKEIEAVIRMARIGYRPKAVLKGGLDSCIQSDCQSSTQAPLFGHEWESFKRVSTKHELSSFKNVIDVRMSSEFASPCGSALAGAKNIPLNKLLEDKSVNDLRSDLQDWTRGSPVVVYCRGGFRSMAATSIFRSLYGINATDIAGGLNSLKANN